jgi:signal transduction histidine kinase
MIKFTNLRARLILLVLIAVLPALGLILFTAADQRKSAALEAQQNALRLARSAAATQNGSIEGARQLLAALAQIPEVRGGNSVGCDAIFRRLLKQNPNYAHIGAVKLNGDSFCGGTPSPHPINFADRSWFQRALEKREFVIGDYTHGRVTGKSVLALAHPVFNEAGEPSAVVFLGLDLAWLGKLMAQIELPEGSTLMVIDRNGTIMIRAPRQEQWVGRSASGSPLVRRVLAQREGVGDLSGVDGIQRLFGFTPLTGRAEDAYVIIGLSKAVVVAPSNHILVRNLLGLAIVAALSLLAAWFGADLFVLRRVNALVDSTKKLATGDLTVRTGLTHEEGELGKLADVFDQMAESLEQGEAKRKRMESEIQARKNELQILYEVSQTILNSHNIDTALGAILEKALSIGKFDIGDIRMPGPRGDLISGVYQGYRHPENTQRHHWDRRARTGRQVREVLASGKTIIVEDVMGSQRLRTFRMEGVQSAILIPILAEKAVLGVIELGSRTKRAFQPSEVRLLEAIGSQTGIAIQKARLFDEIQLNLSRVRTLQEINEAVTSTLDLQSVLDIFLEKIEQLLGYPMAAVRLVDSRTRDLVTAAFRNRNLDQQEWQARRRSPGALTALVLQTKAPVIVGNFQKDERVRDPEFFRRSGLMSYVGIPLIVKNEVVGVLSLYSNQEQEPSSDEIDFLVTVGHQLAIAIHNSSLYQQTRDQAAALDKANKMQADFTAMIAHDLRSPLSNSIAMCEMLQGELFGSLNAEQKKWLAKIETSGRNLVNLVGDFLDVSKLEAGRIDLRKQPVDLVNLIGDAVENCMAIARNKGISLSTVVDPDLPQILADPRRMDQVLDNLLSNAVKFTPEGGKIEVRACRDNHSGIRVQVSDDGVGISAEEMSSLFLKYCQTSSGMHSKHNGTGLGLVVSKMIVEAHGGRIWAESQEGKGSTFSFVLPAAAEPVVSPTIV